MSDCKWTEGEWRVVDRTTNGVNGYEICWSDDGECVTDHVYKKADAHLMAAAKDMFEAIDSLLAIVGDSQGVAGYHLNGDIAEWDEFQEIQQAFEAIAKARGEQ